MRSTISLIIAAWRELWSAAAATIVLGLLSLAAIALLETLSSGKSGREAAADLPMLLAALWGGVHIAAPARDEQLFAMARPIARSRLLTIQLGVLLATVFAAAGIVDLLGAQLGLGRSFATGGTVLEAIYAATCGLLAGCLIQERGPALGLAFTLAVLLRRGPLFLVMALSDRLDPRLYDPLTVGPFDTGMLALTVLALALPSWHYWRHWSPLQTPGAQRAVLVRLGGSLAVVMAAAWLMVPAYVTQ